MADESNKTVNRAAVREWVIIAMAFFGIGGAWWQSRNDVAGLKDGLLEVKQEIKEMRAAQKTRDDATTKLLTQIESKLWPDGHR